MSDEPRVLSKGSAAAFDGMTWPLPGAYLTHIQRKCRGYGGALTDADRLTIASVLEAFHVLVGEKSKRERDRIISRLREAMELRGPEAEFDEFAPPSEGPRPEGEP